MDPRTGTSTHSREPENKGSGYDSATPTSAPVGGSHNTLAQSE